LFANAATVAFNAFDDIPEVATLYVETSAYDPNTAISTVSSTAYIVSKMVLVAFKREEIGAPLSGERGALLANAFPIEASDVKAIFQVSELPTGIVPRHKDRVEADGRSWQVLDLVKDPAEVIWIMQLRSH
jgi:hypothetical protein